MHHATIADKDGPRCERRPVTCEQTNSDYRNILCNSDARLANCGSPETSSALTPACLAAQGGAHHPLRRGRAMTPALSRARRSPSVLGPPPVHGPASAPSFLGPLPVHGLAS